MPTADAASTSVGASPSAPTSSAPPSSAAGPRLTDKVCGVSLGDWCSAPLGDPCGAHPDVALCKADARCGGMPYRGESFVACKLDARGFGENCPTVGCVSLGSKPGAGDTR